MRDYMQRLLRMHKRSLMLKTFETNVLHPKKVFHGYDFIVKVYELDSNKFAGQIQLKRCVFIAPKPKPKYVNGPRNQEIQHVYV